MHPSIRVVVYLVLLAVASSCDCGAPPVKENHGVFSMESNELDFGPVTEFTTKTMSIKVRNLGNAPLSVTAQIDPQGSGEFSLDGGADLDIPGQGEQDFAVTFAPIGPGEDTGAVLFTSDDPDQLTARVNLHGGKIFPLMEFDPDAGYLSFSPTSMSLTSKFAIVRSTGRSSLHITAMGVNPFGSPDFSVVPPTLPATLKPGESIAVQIDYSKSPNTAEGILEVISDDADAGLRQLRLLPDPAHACEDGMDNELAPDGGFAGDGLIDFPNDPGCSSATDEDEYNPPECINGAMRTCGTSIGVCRTGTQMCMNSIWRPCAGAIAPSNETCNGLDDNCNGTADESVTDVCTLNGCAGVRLCTQNSGVDGGVYGACMPIMTSAEVCDGIDNDCNGQIDNGIVDICTINGCLGTHICIPGGDGGYTACAPANPATETCNNVDDNCDGTVDNVTPALQNCGFGVCARTAPACVDGGIPMCMPGTGGAEMCNGIDDDCDGTPDDNLGTNSCGTGACFTTVPACMPDGGTGICVPGTQMMEVCNNVDDDCDGPVDENLSRSCYTGPAGTLGVGPCVGSTQTCSMGAWMNAACTGEVTPAAETCNNVNDDCDSATDEFPDGGPLNVGCYDAGPGSTRNVGTCRDGLSTCSGGMYGNCTGQIGPIAEVCGNSLDDNCGGGIDDGCTVDAGCNPRGTWFLDGGPITYACCSGAVSININRFLVADSGFNLRLMPQPTQPYTFMTGPFPVCPSGGFTATRSVSGGCTETYTVVGTFTSDNTWQGTYSASFTGSQCQDPTPFPFGCGAQPCVSFSRPIQVYR